ncbi:unannotated protein [freshwater metagenome]|uniref:Unannotated protein n=1 Tax=freshwater metagenome TaxID=449393 RepID=A0A6J6IYW2_9ZZZZ
MIPVSFFNPAMNNCSNRGITESAVFPNADELMGNSLHPRTVNPSSRAIVAIESFTSALGSINPIPVA